MEHNIMKHNHAGDDAESWRMLFDLSFFFFVIVILLAIMQGMLFF